MVIDDGTPKWATHPCANASMTVSVWVSCIGTATGQREKWSTAVSKYLKPFEVVKTPVFASFSFAR